jgi:hypothetical protein
MNNEALKDEILNRMDMSELSLSTMDMMDIMNMFNVTEEELGLAYHSVVNDKMEEFNDTGDFIMDFFRARDVYYPSFQEFKKEFQKDYPVSDNIVRNVHKSQIEDVNQTSLFEMIRKELQQIMNEDYEFEKDAAKITKKWGGEMKKDSRLNPEDLFGDESMAALGDIAAEYGEEELAPLGSMEDPNQFVGDVTSEEVEITPPGLIKVLDAEGNQIKRKMIVKPANGIEKTGRVMGFGDDGKGNLEVLVTWAWPMDMKFTHPEEMGDDRVSPESIVVRTTNESMNPQIQETMNNELNEQELNEELKRLAEMNEEDLALEMLSESIQDECMDEETIKEEDDHDDEDKEELDEMRGLGHGVKNSGDRNVKKRDDHAHAPLTDLNESSIDNKIKGLFEGSVKRRDLLNFINEEAKNLADDIRGEEK